MTHNEDKTMDGKVKPKVAELELKKLMKVQTKHFISSTAPLRNCTYMFKIYAYLDLALEVALHLSNCNTASENAFFLATLISGT